MCLSLAIIEQIKNNSLHIITEFEKSFNFKQDTSHMLNNINFNKSDMKIDLSNIANKNDNNKQRKRSSSKES